MGELCKLEVDGDNSATSVENHREFSTEVEMALGVTSTEVERRRARPTSVEVTRRRVSRDLGGSPKSALGIPKALFGDVRVRGGCSG